MAAFKGMTKLDIHARLMRSYKRVPFWWWLSLIVVVLSMSIAMTEVFHTGLPVYGIFLAFIIPSIFMIPCGLIQGISVSSLHHFADNNGTLYTNERIINLKERYVLCPVPL